MKRHLAKTLLATFLATGLSIPAAAYAQGIVQAVREGTAAYIDINAATADGYGLFLGCTSGNQEGAMGVHYANGALVGDGALDARRPEVLMYEPTHDGRMRLIGVEFVVIAEAWHATNPAPPVLEGQLFHFNGSPNRYGLPPFYALHVWAWKNNPNGTFADWNPLVECDHYSG